MRQQGRIQAAIAAALFAVVVAGVFQRASAAPWEPAAYAKQETLKLRTMCPGEGEYWFPVWLVVVADQVYVRLGSKAADRIESNASKPILGVEVGGERFDKVRGIAAPEAAEAVGSAMAEKYTSDLVIRWFSHPLILRLVPEP